jgi:hypothetical protein
MLTTRRPIRLASAVVLGVLLCAPPASAGVRWSIGLNFGLPIYPGWGPCYPYYRPVYVAPPPVYVQPAPLVYQPAPVLQPVPAPPPAYYPQPHPVQAANYTPPPPLAAREPAQGEADRQLRQLSDPDERARADSAVQLGRMKAMAALDPLAATLAGDRSPAVREAAARGLALLGSPRALTALQRAALADTDRDVRHSAQFAMDVIQSGR